MRTSALFVFTATLLATSAANAASKRIAVLDFDASRATGAARIDMQVAVSRALRAEYTVIPRTQLAARLSELGLQPRCGRDDLVGIATAVAADAVLCGKLSGHGRHRSLRIEIYNGGDGRLLHTVRLPARAQGLSRASLDLLTAGLHPVLASAWSWTALEVRKAVPAPARGRLGDPTAIASAPELGVWDSDTDGLGAEETTPRRTRPAGPRLGVSSKPSSRVRGDGEHALRLGVGPAMLLRRNYRVYGAATSHDGRGWTTEPVAGIAVAAELYPGAWLSSGWASHIGLGASFERYFGPTWRFSDSESNQRASHQAISIDLRGRLALWRSPRAIELMVRAGYRRQDSQMNDAGAEEPAAIPDTAISSLETGLALRLPILPRWLHLSASFDYLAVLARGEIASAAEYGKASGGGFAVGGGLRGDLLHGFGWQAELSYAWYTHTFNPDAGAERQADSAADRYLTGQLLLTYRN